MVNSCFSTVTLPLTSTETGPSIEAEKYPKPVADATPFTNACTVHASSVPCRLRCTLATALALSRTGKPKTMIGSFGVLGNTEIVRLALLLKLLPNDQSQITDLPTRR